MLRDVIDGLLGRSRGNVDLINAVSDHVRVWLGAGPVFHEKKSNKVHIDVYWGAASEEQPFHVLVTSGMAERPMTAPPEMGASTHAELVLFLPEDWPVARITEAKEHYWPMHLLKMAARYPHVVPTWLWLGHTIPIHESFDGIYDFCSVMLVPPYLLSPRFATLDLRSGAKVHFFAIVFLKADELEFKKTRGAQELLARAEECDRLDEFLVFTPGRESILAS